MADSNEKETSAAAKTPEDLESEIAATAAALGGKSKKEREEAKPDTADTKDSGPEKTTEEPAEQEEPQKEPTETEKPAEDGSQQIKVNRKSKETEQEEPKPASDDDAPAPDEKKTFRHSGKTIQPLSGKADKKAEEQEGGDEEESQGKPEQEDSAQQTQTDGGTDDEATAKKSEAARKLDALSGELKAREKTKQAEAEESQQQSAKVYDTKKYHLPIKAGRHHRKSMMPTWLQVLVLVIALAGAAYYAYATGLISFGDSGSFLDEQTNSALEERPVAYADSGGASVVNLLASAESIGMAEARVSALYGDKADSPVLTFDAALEQNQAGSFWLLSDDNNLEAVNGILEDNGAGERERATKQQALDFIDIYGFSTLISDSAAGSLNGVLRNLSGNRATTCQAAIDSAIVAMSTDEFMQQKLEKVDLQTVNISRGGQDLEAESFTLASDSLDQARALLMEAIDACAQSETQNRDLKSGLWQNGDILYKVVDSDEKKIVRVENKELGRTVLDIELSGISGQKSEATPERVTNFNSPVAFSVNAAGVCGELAGIVAVDGSSFELIQPSDEGYQAVIDDESSAFVCGEFETPVNENLLRNANQLLSLRSIIEVANTEENGYPTPTQADSISTDVDSWIPSLENNELFDYSLSPNGCGGEQACTSYRLQLAG